jgi:hypothetical protein
LRRARIFVHAYHVIATLFDVRGSAFVSAAAPLHVKTFHFNVDGSSKEVNHRHLLRDLSMCPMSHPARMM